VAQATDNTPSGPQKGSWMLTDQDGWEVTRASFQAKIAVMFFGYRYCPTELQTIAASRILKSIPFRRILQPLLLI
jgi:cytochrome oxidase Cu insertion factor (SCO1/SenC/PrrC family)